MDFRLAIIDYAIIGGALLLSSAVGLYYGAVKRKNDSVEEYFLASRELSVFTMACSLFATIVSSGPMIGIVAEVYYYGFQPFLGSYMFIVSHLINVNLFFPVIFKIGSPDVFTYYELRFFKKMRYLLSFIGVIERIFSNSIAIYGVAVALSDVSGIHIWTLIGTITTVCVVNSALGGVRGVTIADVIQGFVIIAAVFAVLIIGLIHVGGFETVWRRNYDSGRLNIFRHDFNPSTRHSIWTITIGQLFTSMGIVCTSQVSTLRLMASKTLQNSKRAAIYGSLLSSNIYALCSCIGLLVYAVFYLCDPVLNGDIRSPNQLLSMLIGKELSLYTGLAGVFFAGFLCAALSTLSSSLNGVTALVMETFIRPYNIVKTDKSYTNLAKIVVAIQGALALLGVLLVQTFPNVYQAAIVIQSVTNGPHLALMLIGMFFPRANIRCSTGAFGFGIIFMLWIVIGSLGIKPNSIKMPTSIEGCPAFNITTIPLLQNSTSNFAAILNSTASVSSTADPYWTKFFPMSYVSFTWYNAIATLFTLLIFGVLSLIFEPVQKVQKKLSKTWQKILLCDAYATNLELNTIEETIATPNENYINE
ncbi:hypothetical protein CHUAL_005256 [Chamberlinius hualienensis]